MGPSRVIPLILLLSLCAGACTHPDKPTATQPDSWPSQTPAQALASPATAQGPAPAGSPRPTESPSGDPPLPASPVPPTPTPSGSPTPLPCWSQGGRIEQAQLVTELLADPLEFRVYLPACYDQLMESRYPVVYLIHGQSFDDDQWDRLGADEVTDSLVASGELSPFLMVMPRDRLWKEPAEDNFGQALVEVLIPWVDASYRTIPERGYRAVGGLSRGGAWALHLGLSRWELFGAIGMHSGFAFHSDIHYVKEWLDAIPAGSTPRVYIDVGDNDRPDIKASATWFESLLNERNLPHEWHLFSGYHEEAYWGSHVEQYLRWYAQDW